MPLQAYATTQVVFLTEKVLPVFMGCPRVSTPPAAPHRSMVTKLLFHTANFLRTLLLQELTPTPLLFAPYLTTTPPLPSPNRLSDRLPDPEKRPKLYYSKFPPTMDPTWQIILVDPMRKEMDE